MQICPTARNIPAQCDTNLLALLAYKQLIAVMCSACRCLYLCFVPGDSKPFLHDLALLYWVFLFICSFVFRGISVPQKNRLATQLFYTNLRLCNQPKAFDRN